VLAEQSGLTLIQLAIGFVLRPPRPSPRAIIGPPDHGAAGEPAWAAADVVLSPGILDRIDEIVPARHQPQLPGPRLRAPVTHRPVPAGRR